MTKTLIVSGDSYTVPGQHRSTPKSWASYLAEKRKWVMQNYAKGGGSNAHIFNSTIDAIEHRHTDDIVVITCWSCPTRLNVFDAFCQIVESEEMLLKQVAAGDQNSFNYVETTSEFTRLLNELVGKAWHDGSLSEMFKKIVNNSLRYMYLLEEYCKMKNIEYYSWSSLNPFGDYCALKSFVEAYPIEEDERTVFEKAIEEIKRENDYYYYLKKSDSYMGFNFTCWDYVHQAGCTVSSKDHHPNDEGHKILAKVIDKFIDDGIKLNITDKYSRPVYIYD